MPLPSPEGDQPEKDFISDCMSDDKMKEEFPNNKQRFAVCRSQYKQSKKVNAQGENGDCHLDDSIIFY